MPPKKVFDLYAGEPCEPIIIVPDSKGRKIVVKNNGKKTAHRYVSSDDSSESRDTDDTDDNTNNTNNTNNLWSLIQYADWKNVSDGNSDCRKFLNMINKLSKDKMGNIRTQYIAVYETLDRTLPRDFTGNRVKSVSHIIGLGRETYMNLLYDIEIFLFLIHTDECMDFNAHLPMWLRI